MASSAVKAVAALGGAIVAVGGVIIHQHYKQLERDEQIKLREHSKTELKIQTKLLKNLNKPRKAQDEKVKTLQDSMQGTKQRMDSQENEFKKTNAEHGYLRDPSQIILVMIGKTGNGKSTLGNRICGDTSKKGEKGPFTTSGKAHKSCTTAPQSSMKYNDEGQEEKISNPTDEGIDEDENKSMNDDKDEAVPTKQNVLVIDTPGWDDVDQKNDDNHKNSVVRYLKGSGGINAFVMVLSVANKIDGSIQEMLKGYEILFDVEFWNHLMIIVTRVDDEDDLEEFDEDKSALGIQKLLKEKFEYLQKLNVNIPVIPIGKKTYPQQLEVIMREIPQKKFICNALQGPYELLKEKYEKMTNDLKGMNYMLSELDVKIGKTKDDINTLKKQITELTTMIGN